jgi:acetoacetate decarboxylase
MKEAEVKARAFAMPLTSPAYPPGPYRFVNREFMVITYRTDPDRLRAVIPEPLEMDEPLVKYEFIRMPDSTGFGDYTETGQVARAGCRIARARDRFGRASGLRSHPWSGEGCPRPPASLRVQARTGVRPRHRRSRVTCV